MLTDRTWKLKYTPDDADLVQLFSMPALTDAVRHDRLTSAEPGQRTAQPRHRRLSRCTWNAS